MADEEPGTILAQVICQRLCEQYKKYEELAKRSDDGNDDLASLIRYIAVTSLADVIKESLPASSQATVPGISERYATHMKSLDAHLSSVSHRLQSGGGNAGGSDDFSCENVVNVTIEGEDAVTFDEIIGFAEVKAQLRNSVLMPMRYPNLFPRLPKGILLYGLPGTGKTFLVRALIKELSADANLKILFFAPTGAELKGKYVGETEKRISAVFQCASKAAYDCACKESRRVLSVIFIDEVESIARDRTSDETGLMSNSVNMLLQKMDGVEANKNVLVIAATNLPWDLDSAVLRRFTKQIAVLLPDVDSIEQLIAKELDHYKARSVSMRHLECNQGKPESRRANQHLRKRASCDTFVTSNDETKRTKRSVPTGRAGQYRPLAIALREKNFSNSDVIRLVEMACFFAATEALSANRFVKVAKDEQAPEYHAGKDGPYRLQKDLLQITFGGATYRNDRIDAKNRLAEFYPERRDAWARLGRYLHWSDWLTDAGRFVHSLFVEASHCYHHEDNENRNLILQWNMAHRLLLIHVQKKKVASTPIDVRFYVSAHGGGLTALGDVVFLDMTTMVCNYMPVATRDNRIRNLYASFFDGGKVPTPWTYADGDTVTLERRDIEEIMSDVYRSLLHTSHVPEDEEPDPSLLQYTDGIGGDVEFQHWLESMGTSDLSFHPIAANFAQPERVRGTNDAFLIPKEHESAVYNLDIDDAHFDAAMKQVRTSIRKNEMDEIKKYIDNPSTYKKPER